MNAGSKIIQGLCEALAHSIISNRLPGNLHERTEAASEILNAIYDAGLTISAARPRGDLGESCDARAAGGYARAESLSPERRSEIAQKAANARWGKE